MEGEQVDSRAGEEGEIDYHSSSSEVRVVSFDLDNCLWKTSPTIAAANDALADFLESQNITQPVRVEKVMGELFKESPTTYSPLGCKSPVLLTELRKDAIAHILETYNEYSPKNAQVMASKCFDVWTEARHNVIPSHFASSVVDCLKQIQSIRTSSGDPVVICAITDGNSDPRTVPELSEFFDFVVNAESVGVAKPDKRMYLEAIIQATTHPFLQNIFETFNGKLSTDDVEDIVGPWWVHVGDDFIKDVVPAKELKMRSIWARELILKKPPAPESSVPRKSMEEFVKEVAGKQVIEMAVGADDYLADSLQSEFADAVVDSFAELANVLRGWQKESLRLAVTRTDNDVDAALEKQALELEPVDEVKPSLGRTIALKDNVTTNKFCSYCGTKLVMAAKFCSSCGEKQPDLTK